MRARVKVFIDDSEESSEEVDMPVPEPPEELSPPVDGWGRWKWVGNLPKARIDLSENYCLAVYVVRVKSTQARKLGEAARRGVNRTPRRPAEREDAPGIGMPPGKSGRKPLPEDKRLKILAGVRAGRSARDIGSEVGVSPMTVVRTARQAGLKLKSTKGGAREPVDEGVLEDIASAIRDGGSNRQIAKLVNVSTATVQRVRAERAEALKDDPEREEDAVSVPERHSPIGMDNDCDLCDRKDMTARGLVGHKRVVHGILKSGEKIEPGPERTPSPARKTPVAPAPPPSARTPQVVEKVLVAHFEGKAPVVVANKIGLHPLIVSEWINQAYRLMDVERDEAGGVNPRAVAMYEELGEDGRKRLAERVLKGEG